MRSAGSARTGHANCQSITSRARSITALRFELFKFRGLEYEWLRFNGSHCRWRREGAHLGASAHASPDDLWYSVAGGGGGIGYDDEGVWV